MKRILLGVLLVTPFFGKNEGGEQNKRITESATVLREIMAAPDKAIPEDLLSRAQCVGVIPNLKRVGLIVGGKYGKGVLTCRAAGASGWSAPSTVRIEGGSIGLQIGAGETDVVFIVMNRDGVEPLMKDKFTFGADASAMAGPVGRTAEARTDAMMHAKMLAWSRSRGVFAGVSLEGATLRPDDGANAKLYGKAVTHRQLLQGEVRPPASASALYAELNKYTPSKKATD